jgi:hypothetical protein
MIEWAITLLLLGGCDLGEGDAEGLAVVDVEFGFGHDMANDLTCL